MNAGGVKNLLNHPIHASRAAFYTPRNVGVFFIVNSRSENFTGSEAVMSAADKRAWHHSLEASDRSAPDNGGLASMDLLMLKQATLFSRNDDIETGRRGDGAEEHKKKKSGHYQKSGRMHLILPLAAHQASSFRLR